MIPALLATALWTPALLGLGALLPIGGDPALRRTLAGLLGLGVLATAAAVIHLAAPVGPAESAALWLAGVTAFVRRRAWLREGTTAPELVAFACAGPLLAGWMQAPETQYDSGLYYLQAVAWTTQRALTLGLGNLHTRLAYNSAWHVASAALELPHLAGRSAFFADLLPLVFAAGAAAVGLVRLLRGVAGLGDAALALSFAPIWHATGGLGAAGPDSVAAVLTVLALALWARALEVADVAFAREAAAPLLLVVLAVLVKLSCLPLLAAPAVALWLRRRSLPPRWLATHAGLAASASAFWLLRSVLLSGCAVFPAAWTCAPALPWALPRATARQEAAVIVAWARSPWRAAADVPAGLGWVPAWASRQASRLDVRLLAGSLAAGLVAWVPTVRRSGSALLVPLATAWGGIAFVLASAPDLRFAFGFLHAAWILPLASGLARPRGRAARTVGAIAAAAFVALCPAWARSAHRRGAPPVPALAFPELPVAPTELRQTRSGLVVRVPVGAEDRCWGAPLPCTPQFQPGLAGSERMFRRSP
jgi:hypothetical protein